MCACCFKGNALLFNVCLFIKKLMTGTFLAIVTPTMKIRKLTICECDHLTCRVRVHLQGNVEQIMIAKSIKEDYVNLRQIKTKHFLFFIFLATIVFFFFKGGVGVLNCLRAYDRPEFISFLVALDFSGEYTIDERRLNGRKKN